MSRANYFSQARSNTIGTEILEVEAAQSSLLDSGKSGDTSLDERLEKLYRENVKLCEELQHIIEGKSNDMNLLDSIKILAGLREASEESLQAALADRGSTHGSGRAAASGGRERGKGKKAGAAGSGGGSGVKSAAAAAALAAAGREEGEIDESVASAAPSPRISISASRLSQQQRGLASRAGSIPTTREASVKIEDGAESVASSTDAPPSTTTAASGHGHPKTPSSAASRVSNRLVLRMGEVVFCRHDPRSFSPQKASDPPEGEGILCRVTAVIGEGKQRRYEVQDADTTSEQPPPPQRASVSQLIQIPESNRGGAFKGSLGSLEKGRGVLAMYPDTTTFYKAEVKELWKGGLGGADAPVRLNFQDDESPREVERRFVLTEK